MAKKIAFQNDPRNLNKHGIRSKEAVKKSLEELGGGRSILVDSHNTLIAGECTYEQASQLQMPIKVVETDGRELVVVRRTDLSPDDPKRRALAIADNQTARLSEFDLDAAAAELRSLDVAIKELKLDFTLASTGFKPTNLSKLLGTQLKTGDSDAEDIPDPVAKTPKTRSGDLWLLGEHRLLCGDATNDDDVARVLDGVRPDIVLADPPYGVGYEYDTHDDSDLDAYWQLMHGWHAAASKVCDLIVATVGNKHTPEWFRRFSPSTFCFWYNPSKQSPHPAAFLCKTEPILIFGKVLQNWPQDTFVFKSENSDVYEVHKCPKPVALYVELLKPEPYKTIFDPMLGSGTTIIAAEQLYRRAFGIEISPLYCDLIVLRWERFTGKKATRLKEPNNGKKKNRKPADNQARRAKRQSA